MEAPPRAAEVHRVCHAKRRTGCVRARIHNRRKGLPRLDPRTSNVADPRLDGRAGGLTVVAQGSDGARCTTVRLTPEQVRRLIEL